MLSGATLLDGQDAASQCSCLKTDRRMSASRQYRKQDQVLTTPDVSHQPLSDSGIAKGREAGSSMANFPGDCPYDPALVDLRNAWMKGFSGGEQV